MRRGIAIFLLATGAVAGFTIGFARLRYGYGCGYGPGYAHGPWGRDRVAFEDHVADVCTRAAARAMDARPKAPPAPPPAAPQ